MYAGAKKLSTFCAILIAINIAGAVLTTLFLMTTKLNFAQFISIMMYLVTDTAVLLLLTLAIRSMLLGMELEFENNNFALKKLSERIKILESKVK